MTDNASSGRAATYSYTGNDRVGTAVGPWGSDAYTWDASGNRTRADRTISSVTDSDVATIATGTNRLTEIRDGVGVLTKAFVLRTGGDMAQQAVSGGSTFDYVYSPRKRLASVEVGGVEVGSYLYDFAGHRVVRTLPGTSQVIHYIYGEDGNLLAEHDGATGALIKEYAWLDGMPLVQVTGTVSTPVFAYVHTGQIGEPLMVTDGSQAELWDVAIDPWGNALALSTSSVSQDLRFPGQWLQAESGLFQNWHRDYDPALGRYIQTDPIGLAGGSNLFGYANGNPTKYVDPRGEIAWMPAVGAVLLGYYLWNKYLGSGCIDDTSRAVLEWVPIVGDYIGFEDFWNNPTLLTGTAAVAGLVPGIGDAAAKGLKGLAGRGGRGGSGAGNGAGRSPDELSQAGREPHKGGELTKAGRGAQKHGSRPESAYPPTKGNPASINQQGQDILDDILTTPGQTSKPNRFGGEDIHAPDGRGVRFDADGNFMAFLEP